MMNDAVNILLTKWKPFQVDVKERSDRLMNYFMPGYFLTGIFLAVFYDTWLIAFCVGGLSLIAYYSAKWMLPESTLYQYVLSAVLGIFMAQFIYQMHGLFEMHFFAFIGSALLITYQKWKLQIPMLIVVAIHHVIFSYLQNSGVKDIYFTQLSYYDLQTLIIHLLLTAVIFFICGLWSYQLKKYSELQLNQALQLAEMQKEAQLSAEKQKTAELLEERNTILESIKDAFFAVDRQWTVTYWNNTAERLLSVPREDIIGHNFWEVFNDVMELDSYTQYHNAMRSGQVVHFEDYYPALQTWYEASAYPSEHGLSVYFKDITDRKSSNLQLQHLNADLQNQARELKNSNAELEQFAYVTSHDLQEPLRMITSFLTLLDKKYGGIIDAKGKEYIHYAVDGAKRMRQIILDLLEYSRVGRLDDLQEKVDLNKLVSEIISFYRRRAEDEQIHFYAEPLPVLLTYRAPVRQVFQNLISNGLKYQAPGASPTIHISCIEMAGHWQFAVGDNGIGIDPDYFEKIFIIFQRLHNKEEYSGTGMGLAVTKKIVENLGGQIWVESQEGLGSTFYFTLPKSTMN